MCTSYCRSTSTGSSAVGLWRGYGVAMAVRDAWVGDGWLWCEAYCCVDDDARDEHVLAALLVAAKELIRKVHRFGHEDGNLFLASGLGEHVCLRMVRGGLVGCRVGGGRVWRWCGGWVVWGGVWGGVRTSRE